MPPDLVDNVAQLRSAWLAAVEFRKNDKFDFDTHVAEWSLELDDSDVGVEESRSVARVTVTIRWEPIEGEPFETPFDLSVTVEGCFEWYDDYDDDYRRGFTEFNGVYLLWPYLRSYVSMITGAAGLPPFYLPTLTVPGVVSTSGDTSEFEVSGSTGEDPEIAG